MQSAFALEPEPQPKRVQSTSIAAYREIAGTLPAREALVRLRLQGYVALHHAAPTGYELLQFMRVFDPALDLNSVRPRLTALEAKRLIQKGEKRRCAITGKTAFTWRLCLPCQREGL